MKSSKRIFLLTFICVLMCLMGATKWIWNVENDRVFTKDFSPEWVHIDGVNTNLFTDFEAFRDFIGTPTHAADHIQGGDDEIDGDQIDIDFTPANYSPNITPPEVSDVDHLSAHLNGIDIFLGSVGTVVNTTNTVDATVTTIATIPITDDSSMLIRAFIVAFRTDGADQFFYERIAGVFRRAAGAATLQGTVSTPFSRESDGGYNATISVSGNNAIITIKGKASETNNWKSSHTAVTIQ